MLYNRLLTLILSAAILGTSVFSGIAKASENNLIQLDGSGSEDADGDRLIYSWRQLSGPRVDLLNANTAKPSFQAQVPGEYTFELIVSDGRIQSKPAKVNVIVEEANEIPVAVMPEKITIELGQSAVLDGSNSRDADNDNLLYNFTQISGPSQVISSTVSQEPAFTIVPQTIGTYSFELVVNDGRANSDPALCIVDVIKPNSAPVARVSAPQKAVIKTRHNFNTSHKELKAAVTAPQHITIPKTAVSPASNNEGRTLTATIHTAQSSSKNKMPKMVEEISNLSTSQPLNITPIASTSGDMVVTPGSKVVIKGFGVDPDGDSLQFTWKQTSGPIIPGSPIMRKNLAFIPRKEGTYVFALTVNDGKAESDPASCAITVKNNSAAKITPAALDDATVVEDINSLELSIPRDDDTVHASIDEKEDEDDISFRELFSID